MAPKLGKRADYPPFARPYGDLPPKGHIPTSRAGGSGGFNDVDTGAKPAGNGKLIDLPPASQPTTPGPRARGGGRDGGYGGQGGKLGGKSLSLRAALGSAGKRS